MGQEGEPINNAAGWIEQNPLLTIGIGVAVLIILIKGK